MGTAPISSSTNHCQRRSRAGAPGEPGESLTPRLDALAARHGCSLPAVALRFADVPGLGCTSCALKDVWAYGKAVGTFDKTYTAKAVGAQSLARPLPGGTPRISFSRRRRLDDEAAHAHS